MHEAPASTPCPPDSTFVALVERRLSGADVESVKEHLDACAACRTLVDDLTTASAPSAAFAETVLESEGSSQTPRAGSGSGDGRLLERAVAGARATSVGRYLVLSLL